MLWIVIIESILLLIAIYMIWDLRKALRAMIEMWEYEKNRQWLETLKKSGAEIIRVD